MKPEEIEQEEIEDYMDFRGDPFWSLVDDEWSFYKDEMSQ